tara:strand:- start:1003 stop:1437 length:435 start_codon:yes stop_codon:yes gene_type:complete
MNPNRSQGNSTSNGRSNSSPSGTRKKRRRSRNKPDPRKFWGNPDLLPKPIYGLTAPSVTNAIPASLGRAPITGQETASLKFFDAIYERSVGLAFALATAGGLDLPPPEGEEDMVAEDLHNAATPVLDSFNAIESPENAADGNKF